MSGEKNKDFDNFLDKSNGMKHALKKSHGGAQNPDVALGKEEVIS